MSASSASEDIQELSLPVQFLEFVSYQNRKLKNVEVPECADLFGWQSSYTRAALDVLLGPRSQSPGSELRTVFGMHALITRVVCQRVGEC